MENSIKIQNFRNPAFDYFFVCLIPLLAIATAYTAVFIPEYFEIILWLDITFLGFHHVISTYTRLCTSKLSLKENRFLVFVLPVIVIAFVTLCTFSKAAWLIPTIYLHWQWWHYTRQSEGIAKSIKMKTRSNELGTQNVNRLIFYIFSALTFLYMSSKQHSTFLYMPIKLIPIPETIAEVSLYLITVIAICWFILQAKLLIRAEMSIHYFFYQLSHYAIYLVAYVLISDITIGWLAINIWHNFQYIIFVWHFNSSKFRNGIDKDNFILSWLSQPKSHRILAYFSICLIVTFVFYGSIDLSTSFLNEYTSLPLLVIAYQAVNFHHYIVDSLIWKIRKPGIQKSLGISN